MTNEGIVTLVEKHGLAYVSRSTARLVNGIRPDEDVQDEVMAFAADLLAPMRAAIRAAATRAGLLHSDAPLTDDQLLLLLQNVADAAYYARACHS